MKKPKPSIAWPGAKLWKLEDIKPYPNNPRTHPKAQIDLLADLLLKYGPDQPIVVDDEGIILKGHGRRLAAHQAEMEDFPVVQRMGLSEQDKSAMRIVDNQVSLLSGWDQALISAEIGGLKLGGYDIKLLGFSEAGLRGFGIVTGAAENKNPDHIPDAPKRSVVRAGDLWELGGHRLICGDSTKPETWKRLCTGDKASLVFTDPPYGVSYQGGEFEVIEGDDKRRDALYKMLLHSIREMTKAATETAAFYIWHASSTREDFAQAMKAAGLAESQYLLWVKPGVVLGHNDYLWQHEPCFYAAKAGHKAAFYGNRSDSTVWHVQMVAAKDTAATIGNGILILDGEGSSLYLQSKPPKSKKLRQVRITKGANVYLSGSDRQDGTVWEVARDSGYEHPTQKPVELARRAIENSSKPGEIVIDGFMGSGTTLIGAEMTGRRCYGAEMDPVYAEVIIRRWERFSGQKATLDGQTIEQIARTRKGGKDAAGHSRKPVPRSNGARDGAKRPVRKAGDARRAPPGGKPAGEPSALAGDT